MFVLYIHALLFNLSSIVLHIFYFSYANLCLHFTYNMKVFNMNSMVKKYLTCEQHVKNYFNLHYTRTAWLKVSYIVQHGKNFVQK